MSVYITGYYSLDTLTHKTNYQRWGTRVEVGRQEVTILTLGEDAGLEQVVG